MAYENHWLPGFNFNVEEWFEGDHYETLAISLADHRRRRARRADQKTANGGSRNNRSRRRRGVVEALLARVIALEAENSRRIIIAELSRSAKTEILSPSGGRIILSLAP